MAQTPADRPAEPASPPVPPELPPDSPPPPAETPPTLQAQAKPSTPGPVDPPGIAATVLPQRQEDAGRARPPAPSNDR